jgi:predicted anti-sigma-YlaC factor YlaD
MAAMAIADGYQSELSSDQIDAHLADCADCRGALEQQRTLASLLDAQVRRQRTANVWERVERRLPDPSLAQSATRPGVPFVVLGVVLLGYRVIEMIPDRDFGLLVRLVPLLFVIAGFSYLRENPFKIHTELRLEGE